MAASKQDIETAQRTAREVLHEGLSPTTREVRSVIELCGKIQTMIGELTEANVGELLPKLRATAEHLGGKLADIPDAHEVHRALMKLGQITVRVANRAVDDLSA